MAAASAQSTSMARAAFTKALVAEVSEVAATHGVECVFSTAARGTSLAGASVATPKCFLSLKKWLSEWETLVTELGDDRVAEENKLQQRAVAAMTRLVTACLNSAAAKGTDEHHASRADPGDTVRGLL